MENRVRTAGGVGVMKNVCGCDEETCMGVMKNVYGCDEKTWV